MIKKLDSQVEDIKGLCAHIEVLIARVESQNKFLHDIVLVVKSWGPSKSHCDWDTFVKRDKKCMVNLPNRDMLEGIEEKFQLTLIVI